MLGCLCELFVSEAAYKLAQSIVHEPSKWLWDHYYTWNGGPRPNNYSDPPGIAVWIANRGYGLHIDHNGHRWNPNMWDRYYIYSAVKHITRHTVMTDVLRATEQPPTI